MENRQEKILAIIVKEHIISAEPVSSSVVSKKYKLAVSSATIRNEMAQLEKDGYIYQPHTSAGRVPTELAYVRYLKGVQAKDLSNVEKKDLEEILLNFDQENLKQAAKYIAKISNQAIFWAFHKNSLYYTGIFNLFQQSEFTNQALIPDVSLVIDRMEDVIFDVFETISFGPQIFVGQENPFGPIFSTLTLKYDQKRTTGLMGILGPMRMNYEKNLGILRYLENKLSY
jgi:transcriptional regulator of heat shock response